MIKIQLQDESRVRSEEIILEYFGKNKMHEMTKYMESISNDFPELRLLCCQRKLTRVEALVWCAKRLILDCLNVLPIRKQFILTSDNSKEIYEELAIENYQLNTSSKEIISLIDGIPHFTTLWNRRVEAAQDFIAAIGKIGAESVLEVGCGEGVGLFTILQLDKEFLSTRKWVGFDLSVASALNCKVLFESYNLTKDKDIEIYNGDATSIHYEDKSFDVTICSSVLDQIKYEKFLALSEMTRVSKYTIIREPLFEIQTLSGKLHFKRHDYCQLSLDDLKKFGEILSVKHCQITDPTYASSLIILKNF